MSLLVLDRLIGLELDVGLFSSEATLASDNMPDFALRLRRLKLPAFPFLEAGCGGDDSLAMVQGRSLEHSKNMEVTARKRKKWSNLAVESG